MTGNQNLHPAETAQNMWRISPTPSFVKAILIHDLIEFINSLLKQIYQQKSTAKLPYTVTFYLWFDEMAGQLRFNILSGRQTKLPFGCRVEIVDSYEQIIKEFLTSKYHNGIFWNELTLEDNDDDEIDSYVLKIFVTYI
jgi:hypothetical protein